MEEQDYQTEITRMALSLGKEKGGHFIHELTPQTKNPVVFFGLNVFLGWLGVDRFMIGDTLAGVMKLLITIVSVGFLGWVWVLVDCFLIGKRVRQYNMDKARAIYSRLE
ncbi:MAG: TM2 domain-containing protein [Hyphomonadaceae bacterium]|nr:TM2 domain-containing protein [Hyphomonadaceae bacterium]MBC6411803.1 TM2 domain-containing protein [Hyphomonadaceae bacterium]